MTTVAFSWEGTCVAGRVGQSIGAALHAAGVTQLSTSEQDHRPRGLYCCAGVCSSCTVTVDGLSGVAACTTPLVGGEVVGCNDGRPGRCATAGGFEERAVDVLVVGAGERGLSAAIERARGGRRVVCVDRDHEAGGWLLATSGGRDRRDPLVAAARAAGVELLLQSTVLASYDDDVVGVVAPAGLVAVAAAELIVEAGWYERGLAFANNDLPGVMLAAGAQRMLVRDGVRCGSRVVVATDEPFGADVADLLRDVGATVEVVAAADVEIAHGTSAIEAVTVAGRRIPCDSLLIAVGRRPADELVRT